MCVHDDNRIRVRDIQARFDNTRADEDIKLAGDKGFHRIFKIAVIHLPVSNTDVSLGHEMFDIVRQFIYALHTVVHNEHLAATCKFVFNGLLDDHVVALHELGFYRQTVHRRRINQGNIAHARHAQVERARNRSRTHAERINRKAHFTQFFLLLHAKLLFFVDN